MNILGLTLLSLALSADADMVVSTKVNALLLNGRAALDRGEYEKATGLIEQAVEAQSAWPDAWRLLGEAYLKQADAHPVKDEADWEKAREWYETAERAHREWIDLEPGSADAWAKLGRVLLRLGDSEEAIATLYHAHSFDADDLDLLLDLADALLLSREFALEARNYEQADVRLEEAEAVLRDAVGSLPLQAKALETLGRVLTAQGETKEAMKCYRRAITLKPNNTDLHDEFLRTVEQRKDFDNAIRFYTGLVEQPALSDWYSAAAHELKGHVAYNVDGDYEAARKEYGQAERLLFQSVQNKPDFQDAAEERIPLLRSYKGFALTKLGLLQEAESAFFSALDRDPTLENAKKGLQKLMDRYWEQMGGESAQEADFDHIRAFASRVCIVNPKAADCWNNYGFFARESGRYEESYQAYRRAMSLAPDNARILNDTALLLVYHLERDLDRAEEWLWEARDLAEEQLAEAESDGARASSKEVYGDALVNLLTLFYRRGEDDRAKKMFERIEEECPERAELRFWLRRLFPQRAAAEAAAAEAAAAEAAAAETQADSAPDAAPAESESESDKTPSEE